MRLERGQGHWQSCLNPAHHTSPSEPFWSLLTRASYFLCTSSSFVQWVHCAWTAVTALLSCHEDRDHGLCLPRVCLPLHWFLKIPEFLLHQNIFWDCTIFKYRKTHNLTGKNLKIFFYYFCCTFLMNFNTCLDSSHSKYRTVPASQKTNPF